MCCLSRVGPDPGAGLQCRDGVQIATAESDLGRREVLADPVRVDGLGYHDVAQPKVPVQDNLRRGDTMFCGQCGNRWFVQVGSLTQWAVRLNRDPQGPAFADSAACWNVG